MILSELQVSKLKRIPEIEIFINHDLTRYNSFRLKSSGDLLIIKSVVALRETIYFFKSENLSYRIIGQGSNLVFPQTAEWVYVRLEFAFDASIFNCPKNEYVLPASMQLSLLTQHAVTFGLIGWEVFTGIPASLGGAIVMNAGTNLGEICNIIIDVEILRPDGEMITHTVTPNSFSYRANHFLHKGDVVYSARVKHHGIDPAISQKIREYQALRKRTQPLNLPTCGCVFKNRKCICIEDGEERIFRAGQLIDLVGLKGHSINKLQISRLHANFFENLGGASKEDFLALVQIVHNEVQLKYGFKFDLEVEVW